MSTDLTDQIATDLATGYADEPAPRPAAGYLALGRRRQRRRRVGVGLAAAGAVGAIALVGGLLTGGSGPGAEPDRVPVVDAPTPTPTPPTPPTVAPAPDAAPSQPIDEVLSPGQHVGYDGRGTVVLRPGWRVVRQVANPLRRVAPAASLGVVVTNGRATYWYLLDHTPEGGGASWDPAGTSYTRFEQWLDDQVDLQTGAEPAAFVTFAGAGSVLEPGRGVRILRQWADPDLPGFAAPGETTAVAKVEVDGVTYFVLARRAPGGPTDDLPVDAGLLDAPTLAAFLSYARDRYASGQGLR